MAKITPALLKEDISEELKRECLAHLETLAVLGKSKCDFYSKQIRYGLENAGIGRDKTFPIQNIQSSVSDFRAFTLDETKNIPNEVNKVINGFVDNSILKTCEKILVGYMNTILASNNDEAERSLYFAVLEGTSMIRFDFAGWAKKVNSEVLRNKCDKISAFVLFRSVVEMKKIRLNDFIAVYQLTVNTENPEYNTRQIFEKCEAIYKIFNNYR
nr:hypothetical protein [Flavobacterium sp. ASV13]